MVRKYRRKPRVPKKRVLRHRRKFKPAMRIKHVPMIERKYKDTSFTGVSVDNAAPVFTLINALSQGLTNIQRIGNLVTITRINGQFIFTGSAYPQIIKVAIVYDSQANNTAASALSVWDSVGGILYPYAEKTYDNRNRFTILKTFEFSLNPQVTGVAPQIMKKFYLKGLKLPVVFDGTTSGISTIVKGAIYCYMTSSQTTPNAPAVSGYTRITYKDD